MTAKCNNPKLFLKSELWPEGAYVRWFYEKRKEGNKQIPPLALVPDHNSPEDKAANDSDHDSTHTDPDYVREKSENWF